MPPVPFNGWIAKRRRKKALDRLLRMAAGETGRSAQEALPAEEDPDIRDLVDMDVRELAAELFGEERARAMLSDDDPGKKES